MISTEKQFLFIHVPKTGGNSIQNVLKKYSEDDVVILADHQDGVERFELRNKNYKITKHSTILDYKNAIDPEKFQNLFKFATLRNPWERAISYYFSPHRNAKKWNRKKFIELVKNMPTLRSYLHEDHSKEQPIQQQIDFLIRFESLSADFKTICEQLNINHKELPVVNASIRSHYSTYYDKELIKMIKNKYSEEIEIGSYKFERL